MLFSDALQGMDAKEAYRIGLINKVVPLDELMPEARKIAEIMCEAKLGNRVIIPA